MGCNGKVREPTKKFEQIPNIKREGREGSEDPASSKPRRI